MLATIKSGPSGARSGSQTYWPGFKLTVSGETRTPSVKVSANTNEHTRTNNPVRMAIDDENKDFMAVTGSWRVRVMLQVALGCQSFCSDVGRACRARQPARNVVLEAFVVDRQPANQTQGNRARAAP